MPSQRIFSIEEADALVPTLEAEFENIVRLRRHVSSHLERLAEVGVHIDPERPILAHEVSARHRPLLLRLDQLVTGLGQSVQRMAEKGCVVKDLDLGLVDFYSVVDGEPAWLCWQYGEKQVAFFHGLEEGFAGRKPLSGALRPGMLYN